MLESSVILFLVCFIMWCFFNIYIKSNIYIYIYIIILIYFKIKNILYYITKHILSRTTSQILRQDFIIVVIVILFEGGSS